MPTSKQQEAKKPEIRESKNAKSIFKKYWRKKMYIKFLSLRKNKLN